MNEISKQTEYELHAIENGRSLTKNDVMAICNATEGMVANISDTINNVAATLRDINMMNARVEVETKRLEHAFDCMMLKAQKDITIYRETLPILDKNFTSMQARMDKLMDRALDMLCDDVSDESLARQEAVMNMIEKTNDSLNNLISKLLPGY